LSLPHGAITTVIIPTLGRRPLELRRAIESVIQQDGPPAVPLVILNGTQFDTSLARELESRTDLRLLRSPSSGVSNARLVGLRNVDSPLFAFLDDDDELLPNATKIRNEALSHSNADVVVTNGLRRIKDESVRMFDHEHHTSDAARDLLTRNWMHSAAATFRSSTVPLAFFENLADFFEITHFMLRICQRRQIARVDTATFIVHQSAHERVSLSRQYSEAAPTVLQQMLDETERPDLRKLLARARTNALHNCSDDALIAGDLRNAWIMHLRSLIGAGGARYLAYSRHLLRASVSRRES
jgi:hypothetical protein